MGNKYLNFCVEDINTSLFDLAELCKGGICVDHTHSFVAFVPGRLK